MRKFYKFCTSIVRFKMKYFFGYELINEENMLDAKSILLAANHISWFDPPFIGSVIPFEISFLAKAELFKNKLFGKIISNLNAVPVVRKATDMKAIANAIKMLDSGRSLLLFPEGTRRGKGIKPGIGMFAIKTKRDILPIYIENSDKVWSCLFSKRKIKIVFGERIKYEYLSEWEAKKENFQKLADYTYQKIMELKA